MHYVTQKQAGSNSIQVSRVGPEGRWSRSLVLGLDDDDEDDMIMRVKLRIVWTLTDILNSLICIMEKNDFRCTVLVTVSSVYSIQRYLRQIQHVQFFAY